MATIDEMLDSGTMQLPRLRRRWRRYAGTRRRPRWYQRAVMSWAVLVALVVHVYAEGRRQARQAQRAAHRHRAPGRASWFAPRLVENRHRWALTA